MSERDDGVTIHNHNGNNNNNNIEKRINVRPIQICIYGCVCV